MKDEELAEEYTAKNGFGSDCNNLTSYDANKEIEQAFLAGLKAGRPQWHDLEKDPNDLPKEGIVVLVKLQNGTHEISGVSADNRWFCTDYYTGEDKVIAWCEIPTFDKE